MFRFNAQGRIGTLARAKANNAIARVSIAAVRFERPVSIRPLLTKLSIIKSPNGKWGAGLVGGSRRMSEEDYELVTATEQAEP